MKQLKSFLFILILCLCNSTIHADLATTDENKSNTSITTLHKRNDRNPNKRPHLPSKQIVYCTYDGNVLTIYFKMAEGICHATLTEADSKITTFCTFDSSSLNIQCFINTTEDILIEISTDNNNTYTGIMYQ